MGDTLTEQSEPDAKIDESIYQQPSGEFTRVHSVLNDNGEKSGVSAVTVDLFEELIWIGNTDGRITSYYGNDMERYTSIPVVSQAQEIRQILTLDKCLVVLSAEQLRLQLRRGIPIFTHRSESLRQMQCMTQPNSGTVLLGGHHEDLVEFDLEKLVESQIIKLPESSSCGIIRNQGRVIYIGDPSGQIHLMDSRNFVKEHTIEAHSGSLSDFDVNGNLMVTCGFSSRHGNLSMERYVKVYDVRMLRTLAPIPVSVNPFLLRFLPSFSSRVGTVSSNGQMEILETQAVSKTNICLYQVTSGESMCLSFDVSSSCHQMVFGDSSGTTSLFSSNPTAMFNSFSRDTVFAEPFEPERRVSFLGGDNFPLSSVPYYLTPLDKNGVRPPYFSDFPPEALRPAYRYPVPVEPSVLESRRIIGNIGFAQLPLNYQPNFVEFIMNGPGETENREVPARVPLLNGPPDLLSHLQPDLIPSGLAVQHETDDEDNRPLENHSFYVRTDGHYDPQNTVQWSTGGYGAGFGGQRMEGGEEVGFPRHNGPHPFAHPPRFPYNANNMNNGGAHIPPQPHGPPPQFSPMFPPQQHPPPPHNTHPQMGNVNYNQGPPPPPHYLNGGQSPMGPPPNMRGGHRGNGGFGRGGFQGRRGHQSQWGNRFTTPLRYSKHDWKKGSFDESEIEPYNRTKFSGLEFVQLNCYTNSLVQILYHIHALRLSLLSHLCTMENCLACELGFLFHMLDSVKTVPVSPSNFQRAFRLNGAANSAGILLSESMRGQRGGFLKLSQSFNHFILHQIQSELLTSQTEDEPETEFEEPIKKLLGIELNNVSRCTICKKEELKDSVILVSNISYSPDSNGGGKNCKFVQLVQKSLNPQETSPAWCESCQNTQPTFKTSFPKSLPPYLTFNTCLDNAHDFQLWRSHLDSLLPDRNERNEDGSKMPPNVKTCRYGRTCSRQDCKFWHEGRGANFMMTHHQAQKMSEFDINPEFQVKWLPELIKLSVNDRSLTCIEADISSITNENRDDDEYELFGVCCFIRDAQSEERSNLVSLVRVDADYYGRAGQGPTKSSWFLFNDFSVREAPIGEAVSFNPKWKIPCSVYYRKKNINNENILPSCPITTRVFLNNESEDKQLSYEPLGAHEIPTQGDIVGMDAEFVTLEEISTGNKAHMMAARITCVRSSGSLEETPFLDDYISTQEVVGDYLTKFSGIKPGDLDANFSSKNLTPLKNIYVKLRFLVDSGVKFVGHGLNNDFRVINLYVPPEQVLDTVSLFHLPHQRMVSLRFLAWHFLGTIIQSGVHDSVEDARTALALYRKYEELKDKGILRQSIEQMYERGKKEQWKVPLYDGGTPQGSP